MDHTLCNSPKTDICHDDLNNNNNDDSDDYNDNDDHDSIFQQQQQFVEKYPFSPSQLEFLLRIQSIVDPKAPEVAADAENNNKPACAIQLSSVVNHPAIHWIEANLPLVRPLSCYIQAFRRHAPPVKKESLSNGSTNNVTRSTDTFLEAISVLTGRQGLPMDTLATVYHSIMLWNGDDDTDGATDDAKIRQLTSAGENPHTRGVVTAENIMASLYQIALASHVLLHWDDFVGTAGGTATATATATTCASSDADGEQSGQVWNLDTVKHFALLQNSEPYEMIASLKQYHQRQSQLLRTQSQPQPPSQQNTNVETVSKIITTTLECSTFLQWADSYFPQMGSLLSTYLHLALFSCSLEDHVQRQQHATTDSENVAMHDKLSRYALGNRTMFEFPCLYKMELQHSSKLLLLSGGKESKAVTMTVTPTDSLFLSSSVSTPEGGGGGRRRRHEGGVINHLAFSLSLMETRLSGQWYKLYSTESDGFSFLNLQRNMMGYTGPTITLIRPTEASSIHGTTYNDMDLDSETLLTSTPGLFGFYTANPWKESNRYYGSSDCYLFRVEPTVNVYRPLSLTQEDWNCLVGQEQNHVVVDGNSCKTDLLDTMGAIYNGPRSSLLLPMINKIKENFMYFHPSAGHVNATDNTMGRNVGIYSCLNKTMTSSKGAKLRGLVLGGSEQDPRIHITESFERCIASSGGPRDDTFESGPLLSGQWDKFFNVGSIEIWGVGGDDVVKEALSMKEKKEEIYDATRRRVQRVDKSQFLEDFQSGLHIRETRGSTSLFQHRLDDTVRYDFDAEKDLRD